MNVAFEEWIPVVDTSGNRRLASLCSVLTEGEKYADLAVRPHERVSLMRLFLCVAHAALNGPKDYDEWIEAPKRLPKAAKKYLAEWKDSFELFHKKKPWLQVKELKNNKTSPVSLLDFELATGNNATLFDHKGQMSDRGIKPKRIALNLLTFLNFSSAGGLPVAQWKTVKRNQVGNPDSPCLSQSMAHCLLRGKSLMETIHLNIPSYDNIIKTYKSFVSHKKDMKNKEWARIEFSDIPIGKPIWEMFPDLPSGNDPAIRNATKTYLGRLVPLSRWIKLLHKSNQMYCCNGYKYDTFKDGFPAEPTAAVRVAITRDKDGVETFERRVVKADPLKALWRELSALLIERTAYGLGGPIAMGNAPRDSNFDFQVCAMIRDQASMDIAVESVFPIKPAFQNKFPIYQAEVTGNTNIMGAEGHARKLRRAIEEYRKLIDADWMPRIKRTEAKKQGVLRNRLAETAFLSYWTSVEKNLSLLMNHINAVEVGSNDSEPTLKIWRKMLFKASIDAYSAACGQETPRQMRAYAKGFELLTKSKDKQEGNDAESDEEEDEK